MDIRKTSDGYELHCEQRVGLGLDEVFDFFSNAENLERITPPWLNFSILTPTPIDIKLGTLIDYQLKLRGLRLNWRSEITRWDPPHAFVDEQRHGPYRAWRHEHTFEAVDAHTTLIRDHVVYRPPGGPIAPLINRWFVSGDVRRIFEYRRQAISKLLEQPLEMHTNRSAVDRMVQSAIRLHRHQHVSPAIDGNRATVHDPDHEPARST